jgi:DNA invertase Pin-like site-specific DNA recombinase
MIHNYIAYYRVSTRKQEVSGLGLDAQKEIIRSYITNRNGCLLHEFTEQESGSNNQRIELNNAISTSKNTDSTLIVAKLDRLSRNVSFISTLMESNVKFVCAEMPEANNFTLHIFAALAEQERKYISERTRSALHAKKLREPEWIAGTNNLTDAGRAKAHMTNYTNARTNTNVVHAYHYIQTLKRQGFTYQQIADKLNLENYRTRTNKSFQAATVWYIWERMTDKTNAPVHRFSDKF